MASTSHSDASTSHSDASTSHSDASTSHSDASTSYQMGILKNVYVDTSLDIETRHRFAKLWTTKENFDFSIDLHGKIYHVHEEVLSTNQYFVGMFKCKMEETISRCIKIKNEFITPRAMELFLRFLYTRCIFLNKDNFEDICRAASYFVDFQLLKHCEENVLRSLNFMNASSMYDFSVRENLPDIGGCVISFVCENFEKFLTSDAFVKTSSVDFICTLLSTGDVCVWDENVVLKMVCKWIREDEENRSPQMHKLFEKLRFAFLPPITSTPPFMSDEIARVYSEFHQNYQNSLSESDRMSHENQYDIAPRKYTKGIYFVGERQTSRYCFENNSLYKVASYEYINRDAGVAVNEGKLYVTGGYEADEDSNSTKSCSCYDFAEKVWTPLATMTVSRANHISYFANGQLFVVGGDRRLGRDKSPQRSFGVYHVVKDEWKVLPYSASYWLDNNKHFQIRFLRYCYHDVQRRRQPIDNGDLIKRRLSGCYFHQSEYKHNNFKFGQEGSKSFLDFCHTETAKLYPHNLREFPMINGENFDLGKLKILQQSEWLIFIKIDEMSLLHHVIKANLDEFLANFLQPGFTFASICERMVVKTEFFPFDIVAVE